MGKIIDYTTTTPKSTFENLVSTRIEYVNIYNNLAEQVDCLLNDVEERNIGLAKAILGDRDIAYLTCDEFNVWVQDNDVEQRNETVCCVIISKSPFGCDDDGNDIIDFKFKFKYDNDEYEFDDRFDYSYHLHLNSILEDAVIEFSK